MGITSEQFEEMKRRVARSTGRNPVDLPAPVVPKPMTGGMPMVDIDPAAPVIEAAITVQPSADEVKLNKTEKAYLAYLRGLNPIWLGIQNVTLKLGDDCRYTPDFFAIDNLGVLHAREVKGFWRDDAKVKIKVAARMFPFIRFTVAVKTKAGWEHTQIKP